MLPLCASLHPVTEVHTRDLALLAAGTPSVRRPWMLSLGHLPSPSSSQTSGGVTNDPSSAGSNILGTGSSLSRKSSGASSAGSREDSGNSLLSSGVATGSSMGIPNHQPLTRRKKNRGQIETV
uniref:Uncharacterized protein n=1 Tax=Cacopsylla melanoneura TaxID=428564 RepID=A0A8D8USP3_9HEMI